jgi:hypothetical protein
MIFGSEGEMLVLRPLSSSLVLGPTICGKKG